MLGLCRRVRIRIFSSLRGNLVRAVRQIIEIQVTAERCASRVRGVGERADRRYRGLIPTSNSNSQSLQIPTQLNVRGSWDWALEFGELGGSAHFAGPARVSPRGAVAPWRTGSDDRIRGARWQVAHPRPRLIVAFDGNDFCTAGLILAHSASSPARVLVGLASLPKSSSSSLGTKKWCMRAGTPAPPKTMHSRGLAGVQSFGTT